MFVHRVVPQTRPPARAPRAPRRLPRGIARRASPRTLTRKRTLRRAAPRHRTPFRARHRGSLRARVELERQRVVERLGRDAKRVARRARGEARALADSSSGNDVENLGLRRRRHAEYSLRPRRGRPRTRRRGTVPRTGSRRERWVPLDHPELVKIRSQAPRSSLKIGADPNRSIGWGGGAVAGAVVANRRAATVDASFADAGRVRAIVHRGGETGRGTTGQCSRKPPHRRPSASARFAPSSRGDAGPCVAAEGVQALLGRVFAGYPRAFDSSRGGPRAFASREGVVSERRCRRARTRATGGAGSAPRDGDADADAGRAEAGRRRVASRDAFGGALGGWRAPCGRRLGRGEALERDRVVEGGADSASRERDGAELGALAKLGAREERGGGFRASGRFGAGGADVGSRRGSGRWRPRVLGSRPVASTLAEQRSRVREMKLGRAADAAVGLVQRGGPPDAADVRAGTDVAVPRFNVRADQRTA